MEEFIPNDDIMCWAVQSILCKPAYNAYETAP